MTPTWRRCGHPRTEANTAHGPRCRACHNALMRARYARNPEPKRAKTRAAFAALEGVAYNRRLLQMRRARAMKRRRDRELLDLEG